MKLWDLPSAQCLSTLFDHNDRVTSVAFNPDGTCIAAGSADNTVKLWDVRSRQLLQHYAAHDDSVNSVRFHPSGHYLLSTSTDSTIKIWDLREGHVLYTLRAHDGAAMGAAIAPHGDYFASGGADGLVMVWSWGVSPVVAPPAVRGQQPLRHGSRVRKLAKARPSVRKRGTSAWTPGAARVRQPPPSGPRPQPHACHSQSTLSAAAPTPQPSIDPFSAPAAAGTAADDADTSGPLGYAAGRVAVVAHTRVPRRDSRPPRITEHDRLPPAVALLQAPICTPPACRARVVSPMLPTLQAGERRGCCSASGAGGGAFRNEHAAR